MNGSASSIVSATQPAHGTITVNGSTSVTYTATGGYTGADSFQLTCYGVAGEEMAPVFQWISQQSTVTVGLTVTAPPLPATHFSVSAPSSATAGAAFNYTVSALDKNNSVATGYSGTVAFTSSDAQATLPANATLTAGLGTFSAKLATAGSQTVSATDTATSSITGASSAINIGAAAAARFAVTALAKATGGTAFAATVSAYDAFGNLATGYAGKVHFTSSDPTATLPGNSTLSSGQQTFSSFVLRTAGAQTLAATDTVNSSLTGSSASITVTNAPTGTNFTAAPVAFNSTNDSINVASGAAVTGSPISYAVGSATTTAGGAVSVNNSGVASYSPKTGWAGNDTFTFTATNGGGMSSPVTVTVPVSQGAQTITFGALADQAVSAGPFTVSATSSSGLAVTFASSTPTVCSASGATVTPSIPGTCTIVASQAGNPTYLAATNVSQSFQLLAVVTTVTISSSSSSAYFGAPITLTAQVTSNIVGATPTGTVSFLDGATVIGSATLSAGVATFTTRSLSSGAHSVTASYGGDINDPAAKSSALTINVNGRPDPSTDPDVSGLVNAQVSAGARFAQAQIDNVQGRLSALHGDDPQDSFALQVTNGPTASAPSVLAIDQARRATDPFAALDDGKTGSSFGALSYADSSGKPTPAPTPAARAFSLWTSGSISYGSENLMSGVSASTANRVSTQGVSAGVDTKLVDGLKAGFAVGFAGDTTTIGSNGTSDSSRFASASVYGSYRLAPRTFLDVMAGYGQGAFSSNRYSTAGAVSVSGQREASEVFGAMTLTLENKWGALSFAPYAGLQASYLKFDAYTETGSPTWALSYNALNVSTVSGVAGFRAAYPMMMGWGVLTPTLKLEYRHGFNGGYAQGLTYTDQLAGQTYIVSGLPSATDSASAAIGLRAETKRLTSFDFDYEFGAAPGGSVQAQTLRATISQAF